MPASPPYDLQTHVPQGGETLQQTMFIEAAGQTFRVGDPVAQNASGYIVGIAAPGELIDSTDAAPIGIAGKSASNLAAASTDPRTGQLYANMPVTKITRDTISIMPVTATLPANAITALAQQGVQYQVRLNPAGAPGGMSYDINQTSNPMVQVGQIQSQFQPGEQYGTASVKWIPDVLQEP